MGMLNFPAKNDEQTDVVRVLNRLPVKWE